MLVFTLTITSAVIAIIDFLYLNTATPNRVVGVVPGAILLGGLIAYTKDRLYSLVLSRETGNVIPMKSLI